MTAPLGPTGGATASARAALQAHLDRVLGGVRPGRASPTGQRDVERDAERVRPATIAYLLDAARIRSLRPGDLIYPQDEPAPLTLVISGHAAARRTTRSGKEIVSGVTIPGVLFGWSGLASVPSSVELVAITECEVAQWPGPWVRRLAVADPGLAVAAIDSMAWSLQETVERIEGFLHQDARLRVLKILARHRQLFFGEPAVLTRAHLPGLVGTSREMTGKVLRELEREGTLKRVGRAGLELLRPERLELGSI
jgi:CRP-like cAMP-binding protein